MKKNLKYPETTSELNNLISFLDFKVKDLGDDKNPKNKSRQWIRICHSANQIRNDAIKKSSESKMQNSIFTFNDNIHQKIANIIEIWLRKNKFPLWKN